MKIWSATVLLVISIGCTASSIPATGEPVAEVRAVWTKQVDAWNRGDLEGFMEGYWKSPDLGFLRKAGERAAGRRRRDTNRRPNHPATSTRGTSDLRSS